MLKFLNEDAVTQFAEIMKFAASSPQLLTQLLGQLQYLDTYAQSRGEPDQLTCCTFARDFAEHSLRFVMNRVTVIHANGRPAEIRETFWFNGGLIYQGPDNPANGISQSLTVSLAEGTGWFVNT